MIIQYTLSMPQVGSWNGKWSGEDKLYAICRSHSKKETQRILGDGIDHWSYHWTDGWSALVEAKIIDSEEAARVRKKSVGFCNYEWMIDSIETHGKIIVPQEGK
jgi:hypothetical protein